MSQMQRIERYRLLPSGSWEYTDATTGTIDLANGAVVDVAALYEGLPP